MTSSIVLIKIDFMLANRLKTLNPYKPGEQLKDRDYIKLNANENAFPPPKEIVEEITNLLNTNLSALSLYPDPDSTDLCLEIANFLNKTGGVLANVEDAKSKLDFEITKDMIFCGNGSDEVLSFVFYAFFDEDKKIITPEFSYSFYPVYAGYYGLDLEKVPLKSDFSLDTEKMLELGKDSTGMIFANPNAPTGIGLSTAEIKNMLDNFPSDKIFVVDEAYADFGTESALSLLKDYKNLLIVRTFSKSISLAGMRIGFTVGNPELIQALTTVKNSFNHFPVDIICKTTAKAALKASDYYEKITKEIVGTREWFSDELRKKGYFVIPSKTNFIFVKKENVPGKEIYEQVKKAGLLIRHFATPGIEDFVRITIGTKDQMNKLLQAM